jgi:Rrf2 family protein
MGAGKKSSSSSGTPAAKRQGTKAHCADRSSLMNVGRRVDYAIRALAYMAGQPPKRIVPCAEIEARQGVPRHFLSKILRSLVAADLLESLPGARGGFRLRRPATEISVRQVYEGVEGKLCLIDCLYDGGTFCCFAPVCTQIDVWRGAQQRLLEYLDSVSIHDIADRQGLIIRLPKTG